MRHRTNKSPDRADWQSGIGIERDDVADITRHGRRGTRHGEECRVRHATKQPVELMELAALALPPHPHSLARIPASCTMIEQKAITAVGGGAVSRIQPRNAFARRRQQLHIRRHVFGGRIGPVRQKGEPHVAVIVGEIMDFQPLDFFLDIAAIGQQRRYDDHGAEFRRDAPE